MGRQGQPARTSVAPEQPPSPDQLACLAQLAERLAPLTDLNLILEVIADAVMHTLAPRACAIDLFDDESGATAVSLTRGFDPAMADWWARHGGQMLPPSPSTALEPEGDCPLAMFRQSLALSACPPIGTLTIFAAEPAQLPPSDSLVLHNIVIQAAAAISSSRARLTEALALYTVAQSMSGRIQIEQLADSVLRSVANLFHIDDGAILLADATRSHDSGLQIAAQIGSSLLSAGAETIMGLCENHPTSFVLERLRPSPHPSARLEGCGLVAPLRLERKLLGAIVLICPSNRCFRQSDLWLLAAIANQGAMAFRNAQLYLWSEELAIAEERSRIAREIHDGLAQSLAHKILTLDLCLKLIDHDSERLRRELINLKASVRADIQETRHSILTLRPLDLEQRGLRSAIDTYVQRFSQDTGIATDCQINDIDGVPPKTQTAIFRLMQEALNNIRKHANATSAHVQITNNADGDIRLKVADNGRGFDVSAALQRHPGQTGVGLRGMVERTVAANGTIHIDSQPGSGARIEVRLPAR